MNKFTFLAALIVLLNISMNSLAQTSEPSVNEIPISSTDTNALSAATTTEFDLSKCYDDARSSDELKSCAQKDFDRVDQKMSSTSKTLMSQIKSKQIGTQSAPADPANETLRRLEKAEKSWHAFRESQCDFEGAVMLGDPAENVVIIGCMSRLTKERTQLLEHSLAKEPDLAP